MEQFLRSVLEGRSGGAPGRALCALLAPAGGLYAMAARRRRRAFADGRRESFAATVPVVSVGNLTAGGVGKTPFVIMAARWLRDDGRAPAVLLRGYGSADPDQADEVRLLRERLPGVAVFAGRDRVALARRAAEGGCGVIILDDGFQHLRLRRDADFVLLDATCPWGGGRCLPAGLLREPPDALAAANALVLTRCDQAADGAVESLRGELARLFPGKPVFQTRHAPARLTLLNGRPATPATNTSTTKQGGGDGAVNDDGNGNGDGGGDDGASDLSALRGRRVVAAAGIGRPDGFARTLGECGASVERVFGFPDHHVYTPRDAATLRLAAATLGATLVTTEKDAVKLRDAVAEPERAEIFVLGVDLAADDPQALRSLLFSRIEPRRGCG